MVERNRAAIMAGGLTTQPMHLEHRATNATSLNGIERTVVTRWHGRKYEDGATAWWRKKLDSASTPSAWVCLTPLEHLLAGANQAGRARKSWLALAGAGRVT